MTCITDFSQRDCFIISVRLLKKCQVIQGILHYTIVVKGHKVNNVRIRDLHRSLVQCVGDLSIY